MVSKPLPLHVLQANSPPLSNTDLQHTQRSVSNWFILFPIAESLCLNRVGFVYCLVNT